MPAGESLGNGAIFNGPLPMVLPMPGFNPGMMGPTEEDLRRQQQDMLRQQILNQRITERDAAINQPVNYNRPQPINIDVDAAGNALEKVGGSAVIQLDPSQRIRFGGSYMPGYQEQGVPIPDASRIEAGYSTPTFGLNVNYRPRRQGAPVGGIGADMRFNMPF